MSDGFERPVAPILAHLGGLMALPPRQGRACPARLRDLADVGVKPLSAVAQLVALACRRSACRSLLHLLCARSGHIWQLDPTEVASWAKTPTQQQADRRHGYGTTEPNPAVVHLNGLAANAAVAELAAWIAGTHAPAQYIDIDLDGSLNETDAPPGIRVKPRHLRQASSLCIACSQSRRSQSTEAA